ncbi:hypothetical protein [Streptacidiphilus sp. EB103A]|uniref:hypothetical protein n=1 Tax=Streptacidiphilus sp. EB103A TaxID=3156275 RepID=UPI003512564D
MTSYRCEACRTTYPTDRVGLDAVRRQHRRDFHGGGTPDEYVLEDGPRPVSARRVIAILALLVAVSLVTKACGALGL